ncbi:hypothetical protein Syun_012079 [Stephania yunnanensis]|uniref:Aspartic peptidase DDI1-type domain-containing protein n=1 Tax=Stephania yunnanensis TaxID=152371 RepID=A0AAP0JZJ6_9MAGN
MTDQGTRARAQRSRDAPRRPPSSVDDLLGILDPPDFEAKVAKLTELGASSNDLRLNPDGSACVNPELSNKANLGVILSWHKFVLGNDLNRLRTMLKERHNQRSELKRRQEEELKGIDENWATALEYNPETFARVVMLYVDMEVNGVPLKAFVDSGAQSTIISISQSLSVVGMLFSILYSLVYLVLDSPNMEFLFGLDMLRKHQVIEEILKHEWSAKWRSFVPDLLSAAKTSETICENCMAILKVTSISISLSR